MKTESQGRGRHSCCALVALCVVLAAINPSAFGFRVTTPAGSTGRRRALVTSSFPLGHAHQARPREAAGSAVVEYGRRRLQQREWALLSEREEGGDGSGEVRKTAAESSTCLVRLNKHTSMPVMAPGGLPLQ